MYSPDELNLFATKSPRKYRVDFCKRLGLTRRNYALNVESLVHSVGGDSGGYTSMTHPQTPDFIAE